VAKAARLELQNDERDQLITLKNRQIVELTFRVQELEKILSAIPKRGTEKQESVSQELPLDKGVLCWLGYWRDKIPSEAVEALQRIVGV
jgi:hypothetical protein